MLGRIFWDFLGEKYWSDLVSKKIQMKLSKIKVSLFTGEASDAHFFISGRSAPLGPK